MLSDLESWKARERRRITDSRARFSEWLSRQERERMAQLESLWLRRERARERVMAEREGEYERLEAQVTKLSASLEKRERQLVMAEEDLVRRGEAITASADLRIADAEAGARRAQEEFIHLMAGEKKRRAEAERKAGAEAARAAAAESKSDALRDEVNLLRTQLAQGPEAKVRLDAERAKTELYQSKTRVAELEAELRDARETAARQARGYAELRRRVERGERERLERDRRQLEQLRLQYLAREEERSSRSDAVAVGEIKAELEAIRRGEAAAASSQALADRAAAKEQTVGEMLSIAKSVAGPAGGSSPSAVPPSPDLAMNATKHSRHRGPAGEEDPDIVLSRWEARSAAERELRRLRGERDDLLSSALYTRESDIVVRLEERMGETEAALRRLEAV
jgi:hypothetical protein